MEAGAGRLIWAQHERDAARAAAAAAFVRLVMILQRERFMADLYTFLGQQQ